MSDCTVRITRKQGSTFFETFRYDINGVAQDLTGATITASIFDTAGNKIVDIVATLQDQTQTNTRGCYNVLLPSIITWPAGLYFMSIKYEFANGQTDIVPDEGFIEISIEANT